MGFKNNAMKKKIKFCQIMDEDRWRVDFVKEIVNLQYNVLVLNEDEQALDTDELNEILDFICTSWQFWTFLYT